MTTRTYVTLAAGMLIAGVGAGAFGLGHAQQTHSADIRGGNWLQAHSLYFQLIAEIGTAGILGFGFFVLSVLRWCGRLMRKFPLLPRTDDYRGVVARGAKFLILGWALWRYGAPIAELIRKRLATAALIVIVAGAALWLAKAYL